jgi:hypothetical protein
MRMNHCTPHPPHLRELAYLLDLVLPVNRHNRVMSDNSKLTKQKDKGIDLQQRSAGIHRSSSSMLVRVVPPRANQQHCTIISVFFDRFGLD